MSRRSRARELRTAVVCEPIRTPVGRFGGQFKDVTALELATTIIEQLVARTGCQVPRSTT